MTMYTNKYTCFISRVINLRQVNEMAQKGFYEVVYELNIVTGDWHFSGWE